MGKPGTRKASQPGDPICVEEVIDCEKAYIKKKALDSETLAKSKFQGLALSGGGIRSASFGLGVIQALKNSTSPIKFSDIDYLSTVSGGGYIGGAMTWALHNSGQEQKDESDGAKFPLGKRAGKGGENRGDNRLLDFIRQHGNYLTPGPFLNAISLFGYVIRNIFVSLLVYLSLLTAIMVGFRWAHLFDKVPLYQVSLGLIWNSAPLVNLLWLGIGLIAFLILESIFFSIFTFFAASGKGSYRYSISNQRFISVIWFLIMLLFLVGSLPYTSEWIGGYLNQAAAAGGLSLFGIISGIFEFKGAFRPKKTEAGGNSTQNGGMTSRIVLMMAALALIYALLLSAYSISVWFAPYWSYSSGVKCLVLIGMTLVIGFIVNINYFGLHRMYRSRLMETFLPNKDATNQNKWQPATEADDAMLADMCSNNRRRPYHLINTFANLEDSPQAHIRGRGGDSFLLSPLYCGSKATCFTKTRNYTTGMLKRGLSLASAMAISGAAVNPHTGVNGQGATRNKLVGILMGLLNLRLGYWIRNPSHKKRVLFPPNFFKPGLTGDILSLGRHEKKNIIELSDGGHFENLGIYELLRRQLDLIIVADAGADPEFAFGDLANAVEKARVDFETVIKFRSDCSLDGLLPNSAENDVGSDKNNKLGKAEDILIEKYKLAERGYAIADIEYPDRDPGQLIYLKTTLTKGLPADIYAYKSVNSSFPDQSTADQFFDETQFESYRELGYRLAKDMLQSPAAKSIQLS